MDRRLFFKTLLTSAAGVVAVAVPATALAEPDDGKIHGPITVVGDNVTIRDVRIEAPPDGTGIEIRGSDLTQRRRADGFALDWTVEA